MNHKNFGYVASTGLLLSAFALLASVLLGFGGFSTQAFTGYEITGYVSRLQMVFLFLTSVGLIISGVAYADLARKQRTKNPSFIFVLCLAASTVFLATAVFGLTAQLKSTDFWGEATFEEIRNTLVFDSLTLACFLVLGIVQLVLSVIFFKTELLQGHQLSKVAKILTFTSGIFLVSKAIIDYPLIREAIFISSYMLKIPVLNDIMSLLAPIIYLSAQALVTVILLHSL